MKVGLIDVDGSKDIHKQSRKKTYPNLSLMKISAWHKAQGDEVEFCMPLYHYDIVYQSKVFSFTPDIDYIPNADVIIKGGSGYCISLVDGKEVFDKSKDIGLPYEIEHIYPDYSLYGITDTAYGFLTRGCPRHCHFCVVGDKEGLKSHKVADVSEWWNGQKNIELLDPNILACPDRLDLLEQLVSTRAKVNISQGLDIRLMNDDIISILDRMRIKRVHFAWDNPKDDLKERFKDFAQKYHRKAQGHKVVYVLVNFNSTMEENLYRIHTLIDFGYDPYVMIYDKAHAPLEILDLARWCNNKFILRKCKRFGDYIPNRKDRNGGKEDVCQDNY